VAGCNSRSSRRAVALEVLDEVRVPFVFQLGEGVSGIPAFKFHLSPKEWLLLLGFKPRAACLGEAGAAPG